MSTCRELINKEEKIAVIGLGYVGLSLLIELARTYDTVGFDTNETKINQYKQGIDVTQEIGDEETKKTEAYFTTDERELNNCKMHIVAVPTPINQDKTPNLTPIIEASKMIGRNLSKGSMV